MGFERIDTNFQRHFMVSNSIECYKEIIHERKKSINVAKFFVVLFYEIATVTSAFSNHHPDHSVAIDITAKYFISKI